MGRFHSAEYIIFKDGAVCGWGCGIYQLLIFAVNLENVIIIFGPILELQPTVTADYFVP